LKIKTRITLWLCAVGLGSTLVLSAVVIYELSDQLYKVVDTDLAHLAGDCREAAKQSRTINEFGALMDTAARYNLIAVFDRRGRSLWQSPIAAKAKIAMPQTEGNFDINTALTAHSLLPDADPEDRLGFRAYATTVAIGGEACTLLVGKPMESPRQEMTELGITIVTGLVVALLLVIASSVFIAGKILTPIVAISRMADEIDAHSLTRRIPLPRSKDELYRLTRRLNAMFDRLQHSFERQKQFAAAASHELRTPLSVLRLQNDELLQHPALSDDIRRAVARQAATLQRATRLVNDLLNLSALEARIDLRCEPVSIDALLYEILKDFKSLFESRQLSVDVDIRDRLAVSGDPAKIQRALVNLLDNAVKFNRDGGRMHLRAAAAGGKVVVSIRNSGDGIPAADLPHVFDQFYRVEKSRSAAYGGIGLGLTMVREIVERHGGAVGIDSDGHSWVEVTLSLPKARVNRPPTGT